MKDRTYILFGLTIEASKLAYAKTKALKIIQTNRQISTAPTLIVFRGALAIVYPILDWESPKESWSYQLLWSDDLAGTDDLILTGASVGFPSHDDACHAARCHLAQARWNGTTDDPEMFRFIANNADALQRMALEMTTVNSLHAKPARQIRQTDAGSPWEQESSDPKGNPALPEQVPVEDLLAPLIDKTRADWHLYA